MQPLLVACDYQVPAGALKLIADRGFTCVLSGQASIDWFEQGLKAGATVFISANFDTEKLCQEHGKDFILFARGVRPSDAAHSVVRHLYDLKNKNYFRATL